MKIYLAILMFNKIVAAVGPLPGDLDACAVLAAQSAAAGPDHAAVVQLEGREIKRSDVTFVCMVSPDEGAAGAADAAGKTHAVDLGRIVERDPWHMGDIADGPIVDLRDK